jgi:hypothetical protein
VINQQERRKPSVKKDGDVQENVSIATPATIAGFDMNVFDKLDVRMIF